MGLLEQRTAIESVIVEQLVPRQPPIVVIGENADIPAPSNQMWVRVSITVVDLFEPSIGQNCTQYDCILNAQCFAPIGRGAGAISALVEEIRVILKNAQIPGIEFLRSSIGSGVMEADWYSLLFRYRYRVREKT